MKFVHDLLNEFHKKLPVGSKVDGERQTDTHEDSMMISLAYMFHLGRKIG
jgi:hypothetical protein